MGKKSKEVTVITQQVSSTPLVPTTFPDLSGILRNEELSLAEKRRKVLEQLGMRHPRQKYATPEEKKAAQEARRLKRKADRLEIFKAQGIEPRKRGPKKSKAERAAARKARRHNKTMALKEMALANPDLAKKYGINPSRFKL